MGLGNPGPEYARTRHNAGWRLLDHLVEEWGVGSLKRVGGARQGIAQRHGHECRLIKPLMYMNRSGAVLAPLRAHPAFEPSRELLILVDDVALPVGRFRLRSQGSAGGHNGLKSIEGATNFTRALGEAIEGAEGVVRRSIEDVIDRGSYLVRQKLQGTLKLYFAGRAIPADIAPKSEYHVEDSLGHTTYVMSSSSPGMPIGVDLPILPSQLVKIGDTWSEPMKLFKYAVTGESAKLMSTSTLEGLEWEGGYPCAKITTKFSGDVRVPSSTLLTKPLSLTGEATTYFAYRIGKVVSFTVKAYAEPELDQKDVESLKQALISTKNVPGAPGGPGVMLEENPTGLPQSGRGGYGSSLPNFGSSRGSSGQTVKVKMEFVQSLRLVE